MTSSISWRAHIRPIVVLLAFWAACVASRSIQRRAPTDIVAYRLDVTYDDKSLNNIAARFVNDAKRTLVPTLAHWLLERLRVSTDHEPIRLSPDCGAKGRTADKTACVDACATTTLCGEAPVPPNHLGSCRRCGFFSEVCPRCFDCENDDLPPGVANKDYLLYVTAVNGSDCASGVVFTSSSCRRQSDGLRRPIAGNINICPYVDLHSGVEYFEYYFGLLLREMIKLLGFSVDLYPDWLQHADNVRSDWTIAQSSGKFGRVLNSEYVFIAPTVQSAARDHYACPSLAGMLLATNKSSSPLPYWNQRIAWGELMTPDPPPGAVVSQLTLALLNDTGWYEIDFKKAEQLTWGRGLGCNFVTDNCLGFMLSHGEAVRDAQKQFDDAWRISASVNQLRWGLRSVVSQSSLTPPNDYPFTGVLGEDVSRMTRCSVGHRYVGESHLRKQSQNVDREYVYFSQTFDGAQLADFERYASADFYMDYCPYWKPVRRGGDGDGKLKLFDCKNASAVPSSNDFLERYGLQSSCVNFASPWMYNDEKQVSFEQHDHIGSGCYVIQCLKDETLIIDVAGTEYTCSKETKTVDIDFTSPVGNRYQVQLECPSYDVVCGSVYGCPSNCNHRGTCKNLNCSCHSGFGGESCSNVEGVGEYLPEDSGDPAIDNSFRWTAQVILNYVFTLLAALGMVFILIWVLKCGGLSKTSSMKTDPAERRKQKREEMRRTQRQGNGREGRQQRLPQQQAPPPFRVRPEAPRPPYPVQASVGQYQFSPAKASSQRGSVADEVELFAKDS